MDSHVFRKAAWRLPALADLAVLRFNTRGTSACGAPARAASTAASGERYDVAAAIEYAEFADLPNLWLVGWSFGTDLALMHGLDPAVAGAILLSPPLRFATERRPGRLGGVGQAGDRAGPRVRRLPAPGRGRASGSPAIPQAEVVGVPGAKHLWVGDAETVLDEIVRRVAPAPTRCPPPCPASRTCGQPRSSYRSRSDTCASLVHGFALDECLEVREFPFSLTRIEDRPFN